MLFFREKKTFFFQVKFSCQYDSKPAEIFDYRHTTAGHQFAVSRMVKNRGTVTFYIGNHRNHTSGDAKDGLIKLTTIRSQECEKELPESTGGKGEGEKSP